MAQASGCKAYAMSNAPDNIFTSLKGIQWSKLSYFCIPLFPDRQDLCTSWEASKRFQAHYNSRKICARIYENVGHWNTECSELSKISTRSFPMYLDLNPETVRICYAGSYAGAKVMWITFQRHSDRYEWLNYLHILIISHPNWHTANFLSFVGFNGS